MKLKKLILNLQTGPHLDIQYLNNHLTDVFPTVNFIKRGMKNLKRPEQLQEISVEQSIVTEDFLPYYTRDNDWMEVFLGSKFELQNISYETLRRYVSDSPRFIAARNEYEENLVRCYIDEYKDFHNDDFYFDAENKYFLRNSINYDKVFRNQVQDAMIDLGIDKRSIEKSLEKNAVLWRNEVMTVAFLNRYPNCGMSDYVRHGYRFKNQLIEENAYNDMCYYAERSWQLLPLNKLSEHQKSLYQKWMALREYEYYHEHKQVIDQLGLVTSHMKMSPKEATALYNKIQALECLCGYRHHNDIDIQSSIAYNA